MKKHYLIGLFLVFIIVCAFTKPETPMSVVIDNALKQAEMQSLLLVKEMETVPDSLPRTIDKNGKLIMSGSKWWCSGFFPGTLWYLYENSSNKELKRYASLFTNRINKEQYNKGTHDLGFMLYCSYGNALRITGIDSCKSVLINGSKSLSTRFNPTIGSIQSWGSNQK